MQNRMAFVVCNVGAVNGARRWPALALDIFGMYSAMAWMDGLETQTTEAQSDDLKRYERWSV